MKTRTSNTRLSSIFLLKLTAVVVCAESSFGQQQQPTSGSNSEPNFHHHVTRSGHSGESSPPNEGRPLLVDQPVIVHNNSHVMLSQSQQNHSLLVDNSQMPTFYAQAQKFRVNVSNVCEKNQMRATVRLSKPFYGLIHARDKRRKPACFIEGNGEQAYSLDISYTLVQSERDYCGVVAHQQSSRSSASSDSSSSSSSNQSAGNQQTLSVVLVVRLHKTIEFSDDRYFLLSCANRCSRPDCSRGAIQEQDLLGPINQVFRGFVAGQSIVSPVLRASSANELTSSNSDGRLVNVEQLPTGNWSTERCDVMLDLKFQWLIKLCWVLSVLLLLILSIAAYLCLALSRRRQTHKANGASEIPSDKRSKRSIQQHKQAKQQQQDLFSPSISQTSESLCWSASGTNDELLDNKTTTIRCADDNGNINSSSLANQQLLLANLLTAKPQVANLEEPQLASRVTSGQRQQPQVVVMGRAADTLAGVQRRHLEAQVRRRRSIGGSSMPPEAADEAVYATSKHSQHRHSQQQQQQGFRGQLEASQRAKSRSQTTIHYEQSQDPFKAVPFSYLNNGYLSDSAGADSNIYGIPQQQQLAYSLVAPQHQETAQLEGDHQRVMAPQQQQQWVAAGYQAAPMEFIEAAAAVANQQQQTASQFDPQNSRQLIHLIQQKHRQQIAQANRTAASMQAQAAKLFSGLGARAWP